MCGAALHNLCQEWKIPSQRVILVNDGEDMGGWMDDEENFEENIQLRKLAAEEQQFLIDAANDRNANA